MTPTLPDDILYLLCDELLERRDFGTLYAFASEIIIRCKEL
jgi:hypothetical protein